MQIGCTKKLQEFLKKDIIQADQDVDPFYTWSASIMIVNRRRTMLCCMMNPDVDLYCTA